MAGEAFVGFRGLNVVFGLNPVAIHLAEWLCIGLKFIRRDRGGLPGVCCLFYLTAAPIAPNASGAVRATDVMVNLTHWQVQKKP
ncbi:hypothetical protein ACV2F7_22525, partial [Salmonella enterica subsp. enterica serovar Braenderup]